MKVQSTQKYRELIENCNGHRFQSDDYLLYENAEKFYSSRSSESMVKIIADIRGKKIPKYNDLADKLEVMLKKDCPEAHIPAEPVIIPSICEDELSAAVVIKASDNEALTDKTSKNASAACAVMEPTAVTYNVAADETISIPADLVANPKGAYMIPAGTELEIHPLASQMPMMNANDFEDFVSNISGGQKQPIIMYMGIIIDGRHRYFALMRLGKPIMAIEWDGQGKVEDFIFDLNVARRHLTPGQKACLAVLFLPEIKTEAEKRMTSGKTDPREPVPKGRASDIAGKRVGVSGKSVDAVMKIKVADENIFKQVVNGMDISTAKKLIKAKNDTPASQPIPKQHSLTKSLTMLFELLPANVHDKAITMILDFVPASSNDKLEDIVKLVDPLLRNAINNRLKREISVVVEQQE